VFGPDTFEGQFEVAGGHIGALEDFVGVAPRKVIQLHGILEENWLLFLIG